MDPTQTAESVHARVGSVLCDKWLLGEVIGSGGTAAVYEGVHRANGRRVAVKVMHSHLASSEDVVARFQREGYIANKVGHPGAVMILDDDTTADGAPFLVMDRLEGAPLTRLLERSKDGVDVGPSLRIVHEVLDILAAAHAQRITHRDASSRTTSFSRRPGRADVPARLQGSRGSEGTSTALSTPAGRDLTGADERAKTQEGFALGTPLYMAPEQARGRWAEVDARSDLWSAGAILFRLLTGRPARTAANPADMLLQAMTEPAPAIHAASPALPADVAMVADRALSFHKGGAAGLDARRRCRRRCSRPPRGRARREGIAERLAPRERRSAFAGRRRGPTPVAPVAPPVCAGRFASRP